MSCKHALIPNLFLEVRGVRQGSSQMFTDDDMVFFTVAIPTYNGETRLHRVLQCLLDCFTHPALLELNLPSHFGEILVVDNNSSDRTAEIVREYQAIWPQHSQLRYCFEPEQGAAFARQKAVEEAQGELIGFLDDDNWPASDWVAAAISFHQAHPEVGAYGGQIHGSFESDPPTNFQKIACLLAIVERGDRAYCYTPQSKILPPSAGLVIQKQVWLSAVPKRLFLNHKGREAGLASEDLEALLYIQRAGWDIWYNPEMRLYHHIPSWRLEVDYLVSLVRCIGLSRYHIRMLRLKSWQKPIASLVYFVADLLKLVKHYIQSCSRDSQDTIARCERELLLSTLLSPFFLWKIRYLGTRT